jgi:LPS-assembly lipoprotein
MILASVALAASCGFHLRSYDLQANVTSYALTGDTRARVATPLRRGLSQAGVAEATEREAAIVIELLDQRSDRRSVSVAGRARAAEYEMSYGVRFRVLSEGTELAPAQWIERERVYRIDRDNIVGSSEEQAILEREMMQDLVSQIIRVVDAVSRNMPAETNAG